MIGWNPQNSIFYGEILDEISTTKDLTNEFFFSFFFFCDVHILTEKKKISHKPFQLLRVSLVNWLSRRLARIITFSDFPFLRVVQFSIQHFPKRAWDFPLEERIENNVVCGDERGSDKLRVFLWKLGWKLFGDIIFLLKLFLQCFSLRNLNSQRKEKSYCEKNKFNSE